MLRNSLKHFVVVVCVLLSSFTVFAQNQGKSIGFDANQIATDSILRTGEITVQLRVYSFLGGECQQARAVDSDVPDMFAFITTSTTEPTISAINHCFESLQTTGFTTVTLPKQGVPVESFREFRFHDMSCAVLERRDFPPTLFIRTGGVFVQAQKSRIKQCVVNARKSENLVTVSWEKVSQ